MTQSPHRKAPHPNHLFEKVIKNYFRVSPEKQHKLDTAALLEKPRKIRHNIARFYPYPKIIDILAFDDDPWVREAARQTLYWEALGQYKQLLEMPRGDKIKFIERETIATLLVFFVYETDLEVLSHTLQNPNVSLHMLNTLRHYLENRSRGLFDHKYLELVKRIVELKKERILKVSEILHAVTMNNRQAGLATVLKFLLDEDILVEKSALGKLKQFSLEDLLRFIETEDPFGNYVKESRLFFWMVLEKLTRYVQQRLKIVLSQKSSPLRGAVQRLAVQIRKRMAMLLDVCSEDLSNSNNLLTLARAHLSTDPHLVKRVAQILPIEDLLDLVVDDSFPKPVSITILSMLARHPQRNVRIQVANGFVEQAKRTQRAFKEMEANINAYFDIIFNFGQNLFEELSPHKHIPIKDLEYVYELISQIQALPQTYLDTQGYSRENPCTRLEQEYQKAHLLWRTALGQYLGRLRNFSETIQKKWVEFLPVQGDPSDFIEERNRVVDSLRKRYKKSASCSLTIACRQCLKRTCSAESLLGEIEFFLGEFLEYLQEAEHLAESKKMPA